MNKKWLRSVELLEILMNFLTVFFVETALFAAFEPLGSALLTDAAAGEAAAGSAAFRTPSVMAQLLLAAVPVCFWLIRILASRFWLFVLLHAAVFAGAVFGLGTNGLSRVLFAFFAGIYLVVSFRTRLQEQREEEGGLGPAAALIAAGASLILCAYLENDAACGRILNAALVYAFLFFADTYLRNLERFVQFNRASNAHIPVRRMLLRGGGLTAACSLVVVALLGLGVNRTFVRRAGEILRAALWWVTRAVLRLIGAFLSLFGSESGEQAAARQEAAVVQFLQAEVSEQPLWLEILYQVVQYLLLAAAAVFLLFVLYRAVSALMRRFYEGKRTRTQEGGNAEEIRESLRRERKKKKRDSSLWFFAGTPEEKIRRIFIRTVQKQKRFRNPEGRPGGGRGRDLWRKDAREELVRARTARELEILFADQDKETFARLVRLYEKARYAGTEGYGAGKGGCSAEDVKQAEACREALSGKQN